MNESDPALWEPLVDMLEPEWADGDEELDEERWKLGI